MNTRQTLILSFAALAALGLGACGGASVESDSATHRELLRDVPELAGAFESGGGQAAPAGRGGGAGSLGAGFSGTLEFSGQFGGPQSAAELYPSCRGWIATVPNHELHINSDVPMLRFVVNGDPHDTTLVVELPDGTFACNDDTHGLNPAVTVRPMRAGAVRVWVGAFSEGEEGAYRLSVTTDPAVDAAAVGAP
jgi:hypothetical protein